MYIIRHPICSQALSSNVTLYVTRGHSLLEFPVVPPGSTQDILSLYYVLVTTVINVSLCCCWLNFADVKNTEDNELHEAA